MALEAVQARPDKPRWSPHGSTCTWPMTRPSLHRKAAEVLDAKLYAGQVAPAVTGDRRRECGTGAGSHRVGALPSWSQLEPCVPDIVATMHSDGC